MDDEQNLSNSSSNDDIIIILGLIKPLGYSIGEVVELLKGLNEPPNLSQAKTNKKKLDSSQSSKENN